MSPDTDIFHSSPANPRGRGEVANYCDRAIESDPDLALLDGGINVPVDRQTLTMDFIQYFSDLTDRMNISPNVKIHNLTDRIFTTCRPTQWKI